MKRRSASQWAAISRCFPEPDAQTCQIRGPECRGLGHARTHHGHAEQVGLKLHQQIVDARAAVRAEFLEADPGVIFHYPEHVANLIRDSFERGTSDVELRRAPREADDDAARIGVPMRRTQPGKGRHEIHTTVVRYLCRERLDLAGRFDDAQAVTKPLHDRASDEDAAFECVLRHPVTEAPRDGGEQIVF